MNPRHSIHSVEGAKMTVDQLIDMYLRMGKLMGKSEATLRWYRRRLGQFRDFLEVRNHSMQITDLALEDGGDYVEALMERNKRWPWQHTQNGRKSEKLSKYTIHGHVRVLRAFTNWAYEESYLLADPFSRLPKPKLPKREVEILSDDEIDSILGCINPLTALGARNHAMIILLLRPYASSTENTKCGLSEAPEARLLANFGCL